MDKRHIAGSLLVSLGLVFTGCDQGRPSVSSPASPPELGTAEAPAEQVQQLCGACHRFPPPDSFPRSAWKMQVEQAYEFLKHAPKNKPAVLTQVIIPPQEQVLAYFEKRAPGTLTV